ncbi:MAG: hypothetical protein WBA12_00615 [Catalinimonas sp.]
MTQLRTLLHRPVAVLVSFPAAAVFSAVALRLLPLALLPDEALAAEGKRTGGATVGLSQ